MDTHTSANMNDLFFCRLARRGAIHFDDPCGSNNTKRKENTKILKGMWKDSFFSRITIAMTDVQDHHWDGSRSARNQYTEGEASMDSSDRICPLLFISSYISNMCAVWYLQGPRGKKKRGIRLDPQDCFELPALCAARRERRFHRSDCRAMVVKDVGLILSERNQKNKKNSLPYFLLERLSGLNATFFFSIPFSSMTTVILCREFSFCFVILLFDTLLIPNQISQYSAVLPSYF